MDIPLLAVLFLLTAGAVIGFAVVSRTKVKQRMNDPDAPKSTLAKDGPDR
ncbi:hypothetical protein [uncultured Tateyamaria sp.]|nr:hypothetical protein [uncultured Tateyamaria sp.]